MTRPENGVWAVVVTYRPGDEVDALLEALAQQCEGTVVVDNGSASESLERLRSLCDETASKLIDLGRNTGIATAQNVGIACARDHGAQFVLLSDDDSAPNPGMVDVLREGIEDERSRGRRVAAVGPLIRERRPGGDVLAYVARRWGPRRATADELRSPALAVAFLLASGCLVDVEALDVIGGMNDALFIDHVDLEWGLRARRKGYELLVLTEALMDHSLGDATVMLPGREQPVHVHGPIRCYFLMRNTVALIRSGLMPPAWNAGYVIWMMKYAAFNTVIAPQRRRRWRTLARGTLDGMRGRSGPAPIGL